MLTFINKKYIVAPLTIQSNDPVFEIDRMSNARASQKGGSAGPKPGTKIDRRWLTSRAISPKATPGKAARDEQNGLADFESLNNIRRHKRRMTYEPPKE